MAVLQGEAGAGGALLKGALATGCKAESKCLHAPKV